MQIKQFSKTNISERLNHNEKWLLASIILYFFHSLLPLYNLLPTTIRLGVSSLILVFMIIGVLYLKDQIKLKVFAIFLTVVIIDIILYCGQWRIYGSPFSRVYNLFFFWYPLIIVTILNYIESIKLNKIIYRLLLVFIIITSITTTIGNIRNKSASRILATITYEGTRDLVLQNIGNFGFVYSLVLLLPWVVSHIKTNSGLGKKWNYLLIILLITTIIVSEYTTALLLSLLVLCIVAPPKKLQGIVIISLCILIIVSIITYQSYLPKLLYFIAEIFQKLEITTLSYKFYQMGSMISNHQLIGTFLTRIVLVQDSISSFLKSPVVGNVFITNKMQLNEVGGHSEFFDLLAASGGLGFLGVFLVFQSYFKLIKKKLFFNRNNIYYLLTIFIFVGLSILNPIFMSKEIGLSLFLVPTVFWKESRVYKDSVSEFR